MNNSPNKNNICNLASLNHIKYVTFLCLITLVIFFSNPAYAKIFQVTMQGKNLRELAAVEIFLEFKPSDSLVLQELCKIDHGQFLFKSIDEKNSSITVFFANPLDKETLTITGEIERVNYSGDPNIKIKKINYIPGFGLELNPKSINASVKMVEDRDILQYMGITKARILGPKERVFKSKIPVVIGEVETYGFDFNQSVKNIWINEQKAFFISDQIIASNIELEDLPYNNELEITLQVEVRQHKVKKTIGKIKLVE